MDDFTANVAYNILGIHPIDRSFHVSYLNYGLPVFTDEDDAPLVANNTFGWYIRPHRQTYYIRGGDRYYLHREICPKVSNPALILVDHINGHGFDNRKGNLRWVTSRLNAFNRHEVPFYFRGVRRNRIGEWEIRDEKYETWLGSYGDFFTAVIKHDLAASRLEMNDKCILPWFRARIVGVQAEHSYPNFPQ